MLTRGAAGLAVVAVALAAASTVARAQSPAGDRAVRVPLRLTAGASNELMGVLSRERGQLTRLCAEHGGVDPLIEAVRKHLGLAPDEDRSAT